MRTTLTLDDDVAAKVREKMVQTGTTMKQIVNVTLRRGFEAPGEEELAVPFTVEARPMGLRPGFDLDDISGLLDHLDGPTRR